MVESEINFPDINTGHRPSELIYNRLPRYPGIFVVYNLSWIWQRAPPFGVLYEFEYIAFTAMNGSTSEKEQF
jgi:hypothetical protein